MHGDGNSMDDEEDTTLVREQRALSFNPFGDALGPAPLADDTANSPADDRAAASADELAHRLAQLHIPSPLLSTSSNDSSAVSADTNPLFEALVDPRHPGGHAGSPKPAAASSPLSGSFLNPAAGSYAPATAPVAAALATSSLSSASVKLPAPSSGVSLVTGAGQAPPSARRHRLSSASSVNSTRSRRSTNSSLSSIASRLHSHSYSDPDAPLFDATRGDGIGGTGALAVGITNSPQILGSTRPSARTSNSQESTLSLQPSVMSLETTARSPPPIAGYRIPATGSLRHSSFPQLSMCGPAFKDFDSHPIYVCSAILGTAIHPAKAGPHLSPPVRMSFAGKEILHEGRYDLLPITQDMKWYDASDGKVPEGREPIQAGYEESGEQLHHALARIQGFWVPGKTGAHLKGANFPFAGREVRMRDGYKVLCWKRREGSLANSETTEVPPSHHNVIDNYTRTAGPPNGDL